MGTPEVEKTSASGGDARGLAAAQNAEMDEVAPLPLHTGQVVRLRHQEADVFLAADNNVKNANDKKSSSSLLVTEPACGFGTTGYAANASEAPGTCYTLWIVENLDPTVVRPLTMGKPFRLRNLATGTYLLTHYFAVTPRGGTSSGVGGTARTARNTWNTSLASGFGDQGGEAGTHIAFCGREAHLLTSMRSIMTLHSSSFANEGVSFSDDDNIVRSHSILYLKFEHLPPRVWGGLTTGGSALPRAGSEGSGSHASTPRNFMSQDMKFGTARILSKQAPQDAGAGGWGVLGNRGVIGSELQGTMEGNANGRHQHTLKITVYRDFV
jgi:hypothetical protein